MRVDFYQLTRDPVEKVVPALARKTLQAGQRMLIVGADQEQRRIIAEELWKEGPAHFLANGEAAEPHASRSCCRTAASRSTKRAFSCSRMASGAKRRAPSRARS
jgi:DNA polymerase-3 subunit chi